MAIQPSPQSDATSERLAQDLRAVVESTEELLRVTATQAGEKAAVVRHRVRESLDQARMELGEAERLASVRDEDLLADLAGRREELQIVIHNLEVSKPSVWRNVIALEVSLVLLLGALGVVIAPYLRPDFPHPLATIAAFASVILAFMSYLAFRRFSAEYERRRLHVHVVHRARHLDRIAGSLLAEADASQNTPAEV